ncbi:zinc finger protein 484-like isoform X2 [Aricia agestis]|uniref:zinc finger protein 484-like isoform X2 n=1 Tax=Aricia agestis TaxID=91739 RepID=UPI001C2023B8|nr:zinc finger protein 484-like isoform X2 [Aricia agestis]
MSEVSEPVSVEGEADGKDLGKDNGSIGVKKEFDVIIKLEPSECMVCLSKNTEQFDIAVGSTAAGTPLHEFLHRHTQASLTDSPQHSRHICRACLDLVNVLERAEIEYIKVKEAFEAIISKNPLFEPRPPSNVVHLKIKNEGADRRSQGKVDENDSEDEPLALTKRKRRTKVENKRKKAVATSKRKMKKGESDESWECSECNASGNSGGQVSLAAHILVTHTVSAQPPQPALGSVKKEESPDRSQSSMDDGSDIFKLGGFDDDDDSSSLLIEMMDKKDKKIPPAHKRKKQSKQTDPTAKQKREKVLHYCDKCDAKYTSLVRLEQHKQKHDGSRPPYICEVCGAHYKHKRACDVHVAMHKGISDWKCVECNKLFPSKGALQRHNNIHTGKLNYQCDLCGKSFIHTSSFKMHKLSHSGVKPHSCDVCGLALMTRSHLKRHKRVHSGEKRHECGACGKRFSERYNLLAHARSHEGVPAAAAAAPQGPRSRLFRCAFCVERFERRYMLERHCAVAHGRSMERPPPTPRNTMSKLLKAQAQRRDGAHQTDDARGSRSPDAKLSPATSPQKSALQGAGAGGGAGSGAGLASAALAASAWAGAYAAEFGLRPQDYTH